MAIVSSGSFAAASSKIAGTTLAFTSSQNILSGDLATLFVAMDNITTGTATNFVTNVTDNSINYNFAQGTGFNATARTIVTQSDGKILVGGDFTSYNGQTTAQLVRLNTDGTLDTSFNPNYREVADSILKIAIQPNVTGSYYSGSGVWSTGGSLITARTCLAGAGTQNAALAIGGSTPTLLANTEEYNGSAWTAGGNLINARNNSTGTGTQNSSLAIGGSVPTLSALTEEYNGSTWAAGGALITARNFLASAGIQNEALAIGGNTGAAQSVTEEYNGTSWAAGGALITARSTLAGTGTQNAGLAFGGSSPTIVACTEEYNGTSWTAGNIMNTARFYPASAGTQNAALAGGGAATAATPAGLSSCTEEYDGTTWTTVNAIIAARRDLAGAGTQNAGLAFGGTDTSLSNSSATEEYTYITSTCISDKIVAVGAISNGVIRLNPDGTIDPSFSVGTGFNSTVCTVIVQETGSYTSDGTTYTNKLIFGGLFTSYSGSTSSGSARIDGGGVLDTSFNIGAGFSPADVRCYQFYSSSTCLLAAGNFTSVSGSTRARIALLNADTGDLIPTSSFNMGSAGFGANVNSLAIQPDDTIIAVGNFTAYSGSNINRIAKLNTDGTLDTVFSASIGAGLNAEASVVVNYPTSSVGIWVAGGALITARDNAGGAGTQNAGLVFGGNTVVTNATEEYNGTSWAAGGTLITARRSLAGAGIQNEALAIGGINTAACACTEEYNGTSWTAGGALINARGVLAGAGTQNAGLGFGGVISVATRNTEEYDGSAWAAGGLLITARCNLAGAGTQNAGLAFGGDSAPVVYSCTEEYNGTSWATGGALITARCVLGGAGTQNAGLAFGGQTPTTVACTEEYNGITWSTGTAMITGRCALAGAGTQNEALAIGGSTSTATEEYYLGLNRLLVGGTFTQFSGSTFSGSARLLSSGVRDTSFIIGSGFGTAVDVQDYYIQTDQEIIAVGGFTTYSGSFSPSPNRIIRINSNGSIDAAQIGNTWSKVVERSSNDAAGAGSTLALFYLTASYNIPQGTPITASFSQSITSKAATGWVFGTDTAAIAFTGSTTSSAAGGTSQPVRISLTNLTSGSGEYLFIRGVAFEADTTTVFTPTANYTSMSAAGTTGGANITNQSVRGEFRILTTASYFSNPTLGAAASQASIFWTFYETVVTRGRTYFILLD